MNGEMTNAEIAETAVNSEEDDKQNEEPQDVQTLAETRNLLRLLRHKV